MSALCGANKMKRLLNTVLLSMALLISLALLGFVVTRNEHIRQNIFLNDNDLATANRIEYIDNLRGTQMVMVKDKNNWMVSQPFVWEANRFSIENLFDGLIQLRMKKTNLKQPTTRKLTIKTKRHDYVIALAHNILTFLGEIYISDEITKINKILAKPVSYWCQRELFSDNQANIDSVIFAIPASDKKYLLTKHNDLWKFEAPISINADAKLVDAVLTDIFRMEAEQFFSEQTCNMQEIGLATPECRLLVQCRDSQITIDIGKWFQPSENLFFARIHNKDAVMTVKIKNMDQILDPLTNLYDRKIVDMTNITSIGVSRGSTKWFLQKSDSGEIWKLVNKDKKTKEWVTTSVDGDKIDTLLAIIYNLRSKALRFGPETQPQDEQSEIKLTLESNEKITYEISKIDEDWIIKKSDSNFSHLINGELSTILITWSESHQSELLKGDD
ncbi:MAG: DUF4340 domain-containing protein [Puniceicoccales bacterium]|jgi:hypothetical protein|nr:DUF4340 domain-containing protein [Puniceicoccales bacterium]